MLDRHVLLAAKATAHQLVLDLYLLKGKIQHGGRLVLGIVGTLIGGEDADAVPIHIADSALRLQEGVLRIRRGEFAVNHMLASGDGTGGVTTRHMLVGQEVSAAVHQGRTLRHGLIGAADWCQRLVIHLYQLLSLLHDLHGLRRHNGDGVTQVVGHIPHGDHGVPVLHDMAHLVLAGDVGGGKYPHHTRQRLGLVRADGLDNGPGVSTANSRGIDHAVHVDIVGILAVAQHLLPHVQPVDRLTIVPVLLVLLGDFPLSQDFGRQLNTGNDLYIASAAADIGPQGEGDLLFRGVRVYIQKPLPRHDHAGNAEAALNGPGLAKGVDPGLLLKVAESLHGDDIFSLQLVRLGDARPGGLAVDQHGAGPAGALTAAVLDTGQMKRVPQIADQLLVLLDRYGSAVYGKCRHGKIPPKLPVPALGPTVLLRGKVDLSFLLYYTIEWGAMQQNFGWYAILSQR